MKNENSVMAILAAAVGALCSYAAALVVPLAVLLAGVVGGYVSGMAQAGGTGELCSKNRAVSFKQLPAHQTGRKIGCRLLL